MHQRLADATFRVVAGNSTGSGFSFINDRIVITNHHVIEPALLARAQVTVITEAGVAIPATVIAFSDTNQFDFAILQLQGALPAGRHVLQPAANVSLPRGQRILFAGFPHGVTDLLVHEALVSAPLPPKAFYVDGSVNGGNSGGPIVDAVSGDVVGIVTQRRFMGGAQLQGLTPQINHLVAHLAQAARNGGVAIMGVDFGAFAGMMAQSLAVTSQVIEANANSGIGIGFKIDFVLSELRARRVI